MADNVILLNWLLLIAILLISFPAAAELKVDGRLDEPEWAAAQVFRDFVVVEPLTYSTPKLQTEALVLSLPEGLGPKYFPSSQGEIL